MQHMQLKIARASTIAAPVGWVLLYPAALKRNGGLPATRAALSSCLCKARCPEYAQMDRAAIRDR
jgi:hypothetical protein